MNLITDTKERTRFLKFAVVGTIGAVVDFLIFNGLRALSVAVIPSGITSFVLAVINNFTWNRYWTYPDSRSKPILRQFIIFAAINAIGLLIRVGVLAIFPGWLFSILSGSNLNLFFTPEWLSENLSLAIAMVIVMFWNYFVNRYLTYNDIE
ncbi:MAG: GtrA family protein [Anaerolineales bacterium]|nr:GtrA family protein [Anaerolineales bacterium]